MNSLLEKYREVERLLYQAEVREFFRGKDQPTLDQFVKLRREVTLQVGFLTIDRLQSIAADLAEFEPEFEQGAGRLEKAIAELEDAVRILGAISTVLGIVGRIIALTV